MSIQTTVSGNIHNQKITLFSPIQLVNNFVEKEKINSLGITLAYIMLGTGIGSITAALSLYNGVNLFILMTVVSLTMATNAAVLSQQPFKLSTWLFIINVKVNVLFLIYQIFNLFA